MLRSSLARLSAKSTYNSPRTVLTPYRWVLVGLWSGLLQACAAAAPATPSESDGDEQPTVTFRVQNRLSEYAVAYVYWEGHTRVRLGRVAGLQGRTFSTPQLADRLITWCGPESSSGPPRPTNPQSFREIAEYEALQESGWPIYCYEWN